MAVAVVELLVLVSTLTTFRFEDAAVVPVPFRGQILLTTGYTMCSEQGRPAITLATRAASLEPTLVHELAHARDCLDNGIVDGSLLPADAILRLPSAHCTANRAEFYACWVTEQAALAGSPDVGHATPPPSGPPGSSPATED